MPKPDFIKQQKLLFWIIGIGLLILLLANVMGWLYLQQIKEYFVSDLKSRLENIADISTKAIDGNDISLIAPGDHTDPQIYYYQNLLYDIRENNKLQDLYILSPALEPIIRPISTDKSAPLSVHYPSTDLVEKALSGITATGEIQELGENQFLTAVAPLMDSNNLITGILVVEAPAAFFEMLLQFDMGLLIFSFLNIILVLSIAVYLFRAVRRIFFLQNRIKNQEHLVQLGEMAASVAHEIRNPLGIINGTHTLIEKKYKSETDEIFTYIPSELKRLNQLIENFLTFARNKKLNIQPVRLTDMLNKIKLGFVDQNDLCIDIRIPADFPEIKTDADALEQIILNVIHNCRQVNPDNAEVKITGNRHDHFVEIDISDNGTGIPQEIRERIFDPFFTTKEQGSGLGLAISKRLAEQLEGEIYIKSTYQAGTTMTIRLPLNLK